MTGPLAGQVAVVTGAARGIGAHVAVELGAMGATVALFDVLDCADTAALVEKAGGAAQVVAVDVTDQAAVADAVHAVGDHVDRIDTVVTAAGIYGDSTRLDGLSEAELDRVLSVNTKGVLFTVQAALPPLRSGGGSVVCVGSVAGKIGGVLAGPHYAASKGAVHAFVKWLAKTEAANGIRANGVAPGAVDTDMITGKGYAGDYCPLGRLAEPVEIARVVAFLASPAASYMTGTVVDVNGGYFMG